MELSIYDIIKRPLVTTKSVDLYRRLGQYTFEVHGGANKVMIRNAVEKLWNVKVDKVRVVKILGKLKLFNRREYLSSTKKKAIITLKKGYKVEIPGLFETMGSEHHTNLKSEVEES